MLNRKQALDYAVIIHTYGYFCAESVLRLSTRLAYAQGVYRMGATSVNGGAEIDSLEDMPYPSGAISSRREHTESNYCS